VTTTFADDLAATWDELINPADFPVAPETTSLPVAAATPEPREALLDPPYRFVGEAISFPPLRLSAPQEGFCRSVWTSATRHPGEALLMVILALLIGWLLVTTWWSMAFGCRLTATQPLLGGSPDATRWTDDGTRPPRWAQAIEAALYGEDLAPETDQ
jgi:hypothetical protein